MRQTKAASREAQGSSTQQHNQAQEAHLICHVHTEGRAERGCSPPALPDMDIPQQDLAAGGERGGEALQPAQLVLSFLYGQGLPGHLSHAKPTSPCPLGER